MEPENTKTEQQLPGFANKRVLFFSLCLLFVIYSLGIYTDTGVKEVTLSETAREGKQLFQDYNCGACHQLYGLGGYMGPDLTNVISNPNKGEAYAAAFIKGGTLKMPNFNLSPHDVSCLIEYLKQIDKTGLSPVRNFEINMWGDVDYKQ